MQGHGKKGRNEVLKGGYVTENVCRWYVASILQCKLQCTAYCGHCSAVCCGEKRAFTSANKHTETLGKTGTRKQWKGVKSDRKAGPQKEEKKEGKKTLRPKEGTEEKGRGEGSLYCTTHIAASSRTLEGGREKMKLHPFLGALSHSGSLGREMLLFPHLSKRSARNKQKTDPPLGNGRSPSPSFRSCKLFSPSPDFGSLGSDDSAKSH